MKTLVHVYFRNVVKAFEYGDLNRTIAEVAAKSTAIANNLSNFNCRIDSTSDQSYLERRAKARF